MNKKSCLLIFVLIVVIVLIAISFQFKPSTSVSSYRSQINGSIDARVAKWNVFGVTKKNGESISLEVGFKDNIIEGTGSWFFEIENTSEVNASIQKDSTITLRLDEDNLSSYDETIEWDFLKDADNPVNFEIYVYQASAEQLLFYQKKSDGTKINFTEYSKITDEEKKEYVEVIDKTNKKWKLILDTNDTNLPLIFEKKQELVGSQIVFYYECTLILGNQLDDFAFDLGLDTSKSNICFQVKWSVDENGQTGGSSEEEKTYSTYTITEGEPVDLTSASYIYNINGKNYYIDIQEKNFFDYLKYMSSLGGEPYFEFPSDESSLTGAQLIIPFSRLTEAQKEQIQTYNKTQEQLQTIEELTHYKEYLEYQEYKTFNSDNQEFIKQLPYLSMGLKISIQFDLRVEQVD